MNILLACEESQTTTIELRRLGHNAFSCDILPCSGGHPEWHIQGDVLKILNPYCREILTGSTPTPVSASAGHDYDLKMWRGITFHTMDGKLHNIEGTWDLIIAHPPCQFLTNTGNRSFNIKKYGVKAIQRHKNRSAAINFFMAIANAECPRIVIENPIGCISTVWRKPDQIIQPWQFAVSEEEKTKKATCLWLKGVCPLVPRHIEEPEIEYFEWYDEKAGRWKRQSLWYYRTRHLPEKEKARAASKTFTGIARAMAEQWAGVCANG